MALVKLCAPTITVAEEAAEILRSRGYDSYAQGWHVFSIAGESKVRSTIADVTIGQRLASYASGSRNHG